MMVRPGHCTSLVAALCAGTSFCCMAMTAPVASGEPEGGGGQSSIARTVDATVAAGPSAEDDAGPKGVRGISQAEADERRERALKTIKRLGGRVQFRSDQFALLQREASLEDLLEMAREDLFVKVRSVSLSKKAVGPDDLRAIVSGLPEVTTLQLAATDISDAELAIIAGLGELTMLNVRDSQITGAGLAHLNALPHLKSLYVGGTPVEDEDLVHLQRLKALERLGLQGTAVTDEGLKQLAPLAQLKWLDLNDTAITGEGLRFLTDLPNLEALDVDESVLTEGGQFHLSQMKRLQRVILPRDPQADQVTDWSDLDQLRKQLDNKIRDALYEEVMRVRVERRP